MMRNFLLFIIFTLPYLAKSQTITVVDNKQHGIGEVFVFSENLSTTALTDSLGKVDISHFPKNKIIVFQHPSFVDAQLTFDSIAKQNNIISLQTKIIDIASVVVSATKWEENYRKVPNQINSLKSKDIQMMAPSTSADLLAHVNGVFVQRSQLGGGSPMLRGFSANRILIVVDGVRMNNAIFRSGNLHNVILIDPQIVDNTEVILGPGTVIYGSDALGGVMSFETKKAKYMYYGKQYLKWGLSTSYATAANERRGNFFVNLGSRKVGVLMSVGISEFGDLRMGKNSPEEYLRKDYVKNGVLTTNKDKYLQKGTGYDMSNVLLNFRYSPNKYLDFDLGLYRAKTSDVPRYDRLIQRKGDGLKYNHWYYGPHEWGMQRLGVEAKHRNTLFDKMKLCLSRQTYKESRHDSKFGKSEIRHRTEFLDIYGANIDFSKSLETDHDINYGFEWFYNKVGSEGESRSYENEPFTKIASRYPDDSKYTTYSAYVSYKKKIFEQVFFSTGLRYNHISLKSDFSDKEFYNFPYNEINLNNNAVNGSFGFAWLLNEKSRFNLNLASGFRAPNIDDVGKVFDSEPGNVIVPNPALKPEKVYNIDLGYSVTFNKDFKFGIEGFYTYLDDAIVRGTYLFNGKDSIMYDGTLSKVQALTNTESAHIYGFNVEMGSDKEKGLIWKANLSHAYGIDNNDEPLRHVPPFNANAEIAYQAPKTKIGFYGIYNAAFDFDQLSSTEKGKPHIYAIDANGNPYCPEWFTLNFRCNYNFKKYITATFSVENIFDKGYRPYSSGIVAPGRNFVFSLVIKN